MALGKTSEFRTRAYVFALVIIACAARCGPASAQFYWGDSPSGGWGDRRSGVGAGTIVPRATGATATPRIAITGDRPTVIFSTHSLATATIVQRQQSITRRPPRKLETSATSMVVVVGDSMADWLGYGLDEKYADQPQIGIERKIRATSGLVRYDAKNEALDWPQAVRETLSNEKPNACWA